MSTEEKQILRDDPEKLLAALKKGRLWIGIISGAMGGLIMLCVQVFGIGVWKGKVDDFMSQSETVQATQNSILSVQQKDIINLFGRTLFLETKTGYRKPNDN